MPPSKRTSQTSAPKTPSTKGSSRTDALTSQQKAAIDHRQTSIVLSAGAGCGKTFVLTRRFLSHLVPGGDDLSRLVAITFTERAAREMRDRIRKQCRHLLSECPAAEVDHWLRLVRQLDTARISTIHSFCGSLLRSYAVEAALDPRFNLLDETTSRSLLKNAITDGLHRRLAARDADSHELVLEFGLARTCSLLETLVLARYRISFDAWRNRPPDDLAAEWETLWTTFARPKLLRELLESDATGRVLELLREHVPGHAVMRERRQSVLDDLAALPGSDAPRLVMDRLHQNARVTGTGGQKSWSDPEVYASVQNALEDFRGEISKTRDQWDYQAGDPLIAAEFGLRLLRVAEHAGQIYDEQKRSGGWLDFDDLLIGARNLLRDHPEVRRRVARGISLLLVDEFQDTDPIQMEIVEALCGNEPLDGKLFVVGDVKQSIYRFRGAEPEVFRRLRQEIPGEGRLPLTMNFRSQPAILNFVNALFDGALGDEYEPLDPSCAQLSDGDSIEFLFASPPLNENDPEAAGDPAAASDPATIDTSAAGIRRLEAQWIARRLKQLLSDGQPRVRERDPATGRDSLRTLEQKDIVLLFRAMTDVQSWETALRDEGLDYYVVGGRTFFAQQEVLDLVNLCRALDDPDDEVSLIGVLRSPFFSLSDDALLALARQRAAGRAAGDEPVGLAQALAAPPPAWLSDAQKERLVFAGRVFAELRQLKDHVPLARLLTRAVERTGYDAALLMEYLGQRQLANLRKLIDLARQFDQTGLFTLADFVERMQESVGEEVKEVLAATHPESSNVIRLMSIHQSKGLEFPLVVVADMNRKGNDQSPSAEFDSELGPLVSLSEKYGETRENLGLRLLRMKSREENLAEQLRLFYVATTRAADHLILSAGLKKPGEFNHPWMKLLASRFNPGTGQPRLEPAGNGQAPGAKYLSRITGIHVHHACPNPAPGARAARRSVVSLKDLRETLASSPPKHLPELIDPIAVDPFARRRLSVSEIRQADAQRLKWFDIYADRSRGSHSGDTPDDAMTPGSPEGSGGKDARQLGDLVHLVLERVDLKSPGKAEDLVSSLAGQMPGTVSPAVRSMAIDCVRTMLESPAFAEMATARRCEREIEFYLPWPLSVPGATAGAPEPRRLIAGKLDCLLLTDRGMMIFDYKTSRIPPGRSSRHLLAEYEIQLAIYALAVRQLTGVWPFMADLVLLRDNALRVGLEPPASPWDLLIPRIDAAITAILKDDLPDPEE